MNMGDMGGLLKQMQKAQKETERVRRGLKDRYVDASSGGGKVTAIVNGQQELLQIKIDPEVVSPEADEIALLEDMIVGAVNQAMNASREMSEKEIGKLTGGMDIGGLMKMFQ